MVRYPVGSVLEIDCFWYRHNGVSVGDDRVLHNHPIRGEEIVSLARFASGKQIVQRTGGVIDQIRFRARVQAILANPKPYNLFSNNCEHTVSKVLIGVPSSPQLAGYGVLGMFLAGAYVLSR